MPRPYVRAGELRDRVAVQSKTETRAAAGDVTIAWSTESTVYGKYRPLAGRELIEAQKVDARITGELLLRWSDGLSLATDQRYTINGDQTVYPVAVVRENNVKALARISTRETP